MIKSQDWIEWLSSPVTKVVIQKLQERSKDLTEDLINLGTKTALSVEDLALNHILNRGRIDGLGEFLDVDQLALMCEVRSNED